MEAGGGRSGRGGGEKEVEVHELSLLGPAGFTGAGLCPAQSLQTVFTLPLPPLMNELAVPYSSHHVKVVATLLVQTETNSQPTHRH